MATQINYHQAVSEWLRGSDRAHVLEAWCAGQYRINHEPSRFFVSLTDKHNRPVSPKSAIDASRGDETATYFTLPSTLAFPVKVALIPA
jgi:hypothetical protein